MNPLPFTVRVKAAPPVVALAGDREVIAGKGLVALMVNAELPEVPPPGAGLDTVTWAVPAVAMSVAEMAACNCVALINEVVLGDPFQLTTEPLMNPLPFTVRVKAAVPAVALVGDSDVIVGTGFAPWTVMMPPVPETAAVVPSANAPKVLPIETGTDELLVADASVTVTTAATPLPIVLEFKPEAKHINDPLPALQLSVLPAVVRAEPEAMLTAATSPGE